MDKLRSIISPIVEGQIKSFINDHPEILEGIKWKHQRPKADQLKDSLAKRIVNDLTCGTTTARLAAALQISSGATDHE